MEDDVRKVFVFAFGLMFFSSVSLASSVPTLYGTVNVEYLQVDQEDKFKTTSGAGVYNVRNAESRIGARGVHELDAFDVGYHLELGIDSTTKGGGSHPGVSGRIRIRLAYANVSGAWGTLTMGQDTTATSAVQYSYDPLSNTSLGAAGLSQAELLQGAKLINTATDRVEPDLGMKFRTRRDVLKYQTPSFHGLTWTVSMDRDDDSDVRHNEGGDTHYENLLSYSREFSGLDMTLQVGNITWSNVETKDENIWMYGLRLGHESGFAASFLYTTEEYDRKVGSELASIEITRMLATLSYKWGQNLVALTYANRDTENPLRSDENTVTSVAGNKFTSSQIAFGYKYFASDNIEFKATIGQYKHEEDDAALAQTNDNKATIAALGMALSF